LPLKADSRTVRNRQILSGVDSQIYTWEKEKSHLDTISFPFSKSGCSIRKLIVFAIFCFWVPIQIFRHAKKGDRIVLMDLETALLGVVAAKLKGGEVIFDIVDPFAQTKIKSKFFQKLADRLEIILARNSNKVMIPHASRMKYYSDRGINPCKIPKMYVVENVPILRKNVEDQKVKRENITIGYFGTLDFESRGIEWLIYFCKRMNGKYKLLIAGGGAMQDTLKNISKVNGDIEFVGPYTPNEMSSLYSRVDFTWAYYAPEIELHRYAAPNKFYEHVFFKTPIITSVCIPQNSEIKRLGSGINVNAEDFSDSAIEKMDFRITEMQEKINEIEVRLLEYWEKNYEGYYDKIRKSEVCK
jgi:hypothetical protein